MGAKFEEYIGDIRKREERKMERFFKLKEHDTTARKEVTAGLTSFFAIVYIIAVNASILSDAGISTEGEIIATILATFSGCLLVAFLANAPIILAPGMGLNALFTYTFVTHMGLTYRQAFAVVFVSGILFSLVAFTKLSRILTEAIPQSLKEAITVGIGLFIAFIGLQKGGIVAPSEATFVTLGQINKPFVYITILNIVITLFLFLKNIPGNFLISIITGTLTSYLAGVVDFSNIKLSSLNFGEYSNVFMQMDFSKITSTEFWIAAFSLTMVLVFENIGLIHGQVNTMLKRPEKFNRALRATAISTLLCGIFGVSPTVSTAESAAGIAAGGKTGLTSLTNAILFLIALFLIPFIKIIPDSAIAPILIVLGGIMVKNITHIDFNDFTEAFPAFLIIAMIPLTFSIVDGIAFGFISYPLAKVFSGRHKEVSIPMYIVACMFLLNFILHALNL